LPVSSGNCNQEGEFMLDLIAIAVTILFFALAVWYVRFCERI
jgi:hypothetical protein